MTNTGKDEMCEFLQIHTLFWLGGGPFVSAVELHGVHNVRQTGKRTAEEIVREASAFEIKSHNVINHQVFISSLQNWFTV